MVEVSSDRAHYQVHAANMQPRTELPCIDMHAWNHSTCAPCLPFHVWLTRTVQQYRAGYQLMWSPRTTAAVLSTGKIAESTVSKQHYLT